MFFFMKIPEKMLIAQNVDSKNVLYLPIFRICCINSQFPDTISPLSEHSLSSPVEDGGGYQSEVRYNIQYYIVTGNI